jgi:DNA-binding NarL/FixJ family response regulator
MPMLPDRAPQSSPKTEAPVESATVLIVDHEYSTRKALRALLQSIGVVHIGDAADGPSGLDAVRSLVPDVVLLDWEMPDMDGAAFTRCVRAPNASACPNVPIIMLAGHGERSHVLEAVRLGVHEFLLKPVSGDALLARIVSVLSKPHPCGTAVRRP